MSYYHGQQGVYPSFDFGQLSASGSIPVELPPHLGAEEVDSKEGVADSGQEGEGPPKKKRNRRPVTCSQCRKRKLKCDRQDPCGACKDRNEGHLCEWEGAIRLPAANYTRDQETKELREQLNRLEGIISSFSSLQEGGGFDEEEDESESGSGEDELAESNYAAQALGLLATTGNASSLSYRMSMGLTDNTQLPNLTEIIPAAYELRETIQTFSSYLPLLPIIDSASLLQAVLSRTPWPSTTAPADIGLAALLLAVSGWVLQYGQLDGSSVAGSSRNYTKAREMFRAALNLLDDDSSGMDLNKIRAFLVIHRFMAIEMSPSAGLVLKAAHEGALLLGLNLPDSSASARAGVELWWFLNATIALFAHGRQPAPSQIPSYPSFRARMSHLSMFSNEITSLFAQIQGSQFSNMVAVGAALQAGAGDARELGGGAIDLDLREQALLIRLFRPFTTRGVIDPRFRFGKATCSKAARRTLHLFKSHGRTSAFAAQVGAQHALNAAIILSIDALQEPQEPVARYNQQVVAEALAALSTFSYWTKSQVWPKAFTVASKLHATAQASMDGLGGDGKGKKRDVTGAVVNGGVGAFTEPDIPRPPANSLAVTFRQALPLPMSAENLSWKTAPQAQVTEWTSLWDGLIAYPALYAIPDRDEWAYLCTRIPALGGRAAPPDSSLVDSLLRT